MNEATGYSISTQARCMFGDSVWMRAPDSGPETLEVLKSQGPDCKGMRI